MSGRPVLFVVIFGLIAMIGCSTSLRTANIPQTGLLVKNYTTVPDSTQEVFIKQAISPEQDSLTLSEAIQRVLLRNPGLQSYLTEIRAREARAFQTSFAPNPEIEFEVENFAGSGEFRGFNNPELTISVGQLIELAGKRDKRTRAAVLQSDIAARDYEAKKLDIVTETIKQYLQLISDQQQIELNREVASVSNTLFQTVNRLVQAGKISPAEILRAQILLSAAQLELNESQRKYEVDKIRLASLWGETSPGFRSVTGSLGTFTAIPPVDSLVQFLSENPEIVRWAAEIKFRQAMEELEGAMQIPDPTLRAGYRYISEPDLNAFVANLSVPVPIFNKNQGAVQEAYNRRKKAEEQRRQTEIALYTKMIELYQKIQALYTNIDTTNKIIIPEAEKAYQIINDGYLSGKFRFLDVLDAQRTLYETRKNLITSLTEYNIGVAELERLIGRSLTSIIN